MEGIEWWRPKKVVPTTRISIPFFSVKNTKFMFNKAFFEAFLMEAKYVKLGYLRSDDKVCIVPCSKGDLKGIKLRKAANAKCPPFYINCKEFIREHELRIAIEVTYRVYCLWSEEFKVVLSENIEKCMTRINMKEKQDEATR